MKEIDHDDYGRKIGTALKAIVQLHQDTSKLLSDCDKLFAGKRSIFGNYVTADLSWNINARQWMAEGVFRSWELGDNIVAGITVIFFEFAQPVIVIGKIVYNNPENQIMKNVARGWDLWNTSIDSGEFINKDAIELGKNDDSRIDYVKYRMVDLYRIESIDDISEIFRDCGVDISQ